jgi:hypothetical protein
MALHHPFPRQPDRLGAASSEPALQTVRVPRPARELAAGRERGVGGGAVRRAGLDEVSGLGAGDVDAAGAEVRCEGRVEDGGELDQLGHQARLPQHRRHVLHVIRACLLRALPPPRSPSP